MRGNRIILKDLDEQSGAAAIVRDISNIQRLDPARLPREVSVDADFTYMEEERASELFAGPAPDGDVEPVEDFNEVENDFGYGSSRVSR